MISFGPISVQPISSDGVGVVTGLGGLASSVAIGQFSVTASTPVVPIATTGGAVSGGVAPTQWKPTPMAGGALLVGIPSSVSIGQFTVHRYELVLTDKAILHMALTVNQAPVIYLDTRQAPYLILSTKELIELNDYAGLSLEDFAEMVLTDGQR